MPAMDRLSAHLAARPAQLKKLKADGVKVVGYFPGDFVPEEIIYASGAVPICLCRGGDPRPVGAALSGTTRFLCPFAKGLYGERLLGEQPYYNMVDMLVAPITCQHLDRAAGMWQFNSDIAVFRLGVPLEYDAQDSLKYYQERLETLKKRLEGFTGTAITDENLNKAIKLYNTMRGLLRKISLMRKSSVPAISALDFIKLNHYSFYADPAFMVDVLSSLCTELEQKPTGKRDEDSPRLLITGPNIAHGDYKVLELAQELGAEIVVEEFCEGMRYYWGDVGDGNAPLEALAKKYLADRLPCGFMPGAARKRYDFLIKLAREFNVDGIVWYQLLFCETYDIESYYFSKKAQQEAGLPVLKLQSDYDVLDRGPIKTRLEAFLETLKGGVGR